MVALSQAMEDEQVITITIVRPGREDEMVRLEPGLTVSEAKEELSAQLKIEGPLQLGNVILRSAKQLEVGKLYTLLVQDTAGKHSKLDAHILQLSMSYHRLVTIPIKISLQDRDFPALPCILL